MQTHWTEITSGLDIYQDVIQVGILKADGRILLIGCGEGTFLEQGRVTAEDVDWVLLTHHHRDEAANLAALLSAHAKLCVPAEERFLFESVEEFWADESKHYHLYDFHPTNLTLRESVSVGRAVRGGDTFTWNGWNIEVIDTPGHTLGSVSYLVEGQHARVAFVGDLIYAPGQIWDFYSLQGRLQFADGGQSSEYHGFGENADHILASLESVLERQPDFLVPSHGVVMGVPQRAVGVLRENLERALENYRRISAGRWYFPSAKPEWQAAQKEAARNVRELPAWVLEPYGTSRALLAEDRSIFVLDCAGDCPQAIQAQQEQNNITSVDGVWITHYHDDHVGAIATLRSQQGCPVIVHERMQDILRRPSAYLMPCLHHEPVEVDRTVTTGESWEWKEFRLTAYDFPGQSYYDTALLVERDGISILFVGDSMTPGGLDDYCCFNRNLLGEGCGYQRCLALLDDIQPDFLVNQHVGKAFTFSEQQRREMLKLLQQRVELFRQLFPWVHPNYGLDHQWVRCYPYAQIAYAGKEVYFKVRVLNHSDVSHTASASLRLPASWTPIVGNGKKQVEPEQEQEILLSARIPATAEQKRYIIGFVVTYDEQCLGEIAEGIVDVRD